MRNPVIKILLVFTMITLFCSCGAGVGDTAEELSGGYTFRTDGSMRYLLSNIFQKQIYPNIVNHTYNEDYILIAQKPSKEFHKVLLANHLDARYGILATMDSVDLSPARFQFFKSQLISDSSLYRMLSRRISTENTVQDIKMSQQIADSIVKNEPYYQDIFSREINYWIISHKERNENDYMPMSKIYGPYSKEEYLQKREKLGVPETLNLGM